MNTKLLIAALSAALISSPAAAADFGIVNQPAPAGFEPGYSWTGFYAGIFAGLGGGKSVLTLTDPAGFGSIDFSGNSTGGIAGIQVGADYQFDGFVLGAVADLALSNVAVNSSFGVGGGGPVAFAYESTLDYLGTVRVRAGFVPMDNLLAYAHGGVAFGRTSPNLGNALGGIGLDLDKVNRFGYTIGAGLEYRVTENISIQTEYAYTDFGSQSVGYTVGGGGGIPPGTAIDEEMNFHSVKAGVNFRF